MSWPDPKLVHNLNSHLQEGLVSVLAHQFQMYLDQLVGMQPGTSEDLLVESIGCCRTNYTEASAELILPFLADTHIAALQSHFLSLTTDPH